MSDEKKEEKPIYTLEDDEFHKYFARKAAENEEFTIKCYRVTRKGKKTYKTWLQDYIDECPEEQDLAEEYGGGRYWMVAWDDKNRKLEKTIWIDELWTRKLIESRRVDPGPPKSIDDNRPDPLEYMGKVLDMIKPMLSQTQNNEPNHMADMAVKMMDGMTNSMLDSVGKIQRSLITQQLKKIDAPAPAEIDKESNGEKMSLVRDIIDLAKQFGGSLLAANGTKGKIMEKVIKSDERFEKVAEDPQLYDALYTEAVKDPDIGKAKADALFKKLGFNVDEPETVPTETESEKMQ